MASKTSSGSYIDPDFAIHPTTRRNRSGQDSSTWWNRSPSNSPDRAYLNTKVNSSRRKEVHFGVKPFKSPPELQRQKVESMSSTTSSIYIDQDGMFAPYSRPVEDHSHDIERHRSHHCHRSPSSTATYIPEYEHEPNPFNWPKIRPSSQKHKSRTMSASKETPIIKPLTERQWSAIRKIVCSPPKRPRERKTAPARQTPRKSVYLKVPNLDSNKRSQASDSEQSVSPWSFPQLDARSAFKKANLGKKRATSARKPNGKLVPMADLLNILEEDNESHHSKEEQLPKPPNKSRGKQKVKKQKQEAAKPKTPSESEEFYLCGGSEMTEREKPSISFRGQSPTPSSKIKGWDMEPHSSPLSHSVVKPASLAGLGAGWGMGDMLDDAANSNRKGKGSHRSGRSHQTSKKAPSAVAGSVVWGRAEGVAGAGTEAWTSNGAAAFHGSQKSNSKPSEKTGSGQSGSSMGNGWGGDVRLDTIPEDALLESSAKRNDDRQYDFGEMVDDWDLKDRPASKQVFGSTSEERRSRISQPEDNQSSQNQPRFRQGSRAKNEGGRSKTSQFVDDWNTNGEQKSRQGSASRSEGHRSRLSKPVDDWGMQGQVASKQGSAHRNESRRSVTSEPANGRNQEAKSASKPDSQLSRKTPSIPRSRSSQVQELPDKSPSIHDSANRSYRSSSQNYFSTSHSKRPSEQPRPRSHHSHKTSSSGKHLSASLSPRRSATAGSYRAPTVEEDPENWHGWKERGRKTRKGKSSDKSKSEAAVEEWLGSVKAPSIGSTVTSTSSTKGKVPGGKATAVSGWNTSNGNSPSLKTKSIGSTATSTSSTRAARYTVESGWETGKSPSSASFGTGYGQRNNSPMGKVDEEEEERGGWSTLSVPRGKTAQAGCWPKGSRISSSSSSSCSSKRGSIGKERRQDNSWNSPNSSSLRASIGRNTSLASLASPNIHDAGHDGKSGGHWNTPTSSFSRRMGISKASRASKRNVPPVEGKWSDKDGQWDDNDGEWTDKDGEWSDKDGEWSDKAGRWSDKDGRWSEKDRGWSDKDRGWGDDTSVVAREQWPDHGSDATSHASRVLSRQSRTSGEKDNGRTVGFF